MKTVKPQKLGLLTRNFEYRKRFYLGISILMYIPLDSPPDLLSEASLWETVPEEIGKEGVLDAGIPKARAEFLAAGYAFPPGGQSSPACTVRIALGNREKTLNVFGDRQWKLGTLSRPAPFRKMELSWQRAYGGQGFAQNPLGRGVKTVKTVGGKTRMLPNLQYAADTLYDPDIGIRPANFGPLDITWPQRSSKAGTYNKEWLERDFPAFARDIDWTLFNVAPSDQWFDDYLRGDESFCLENLHQDKPRIEGRLPGFAGRCFVTRRKQSEEVFEELNPRLSTVWFFPHLERAVLIHQSLCETVDEDGSDIVHLMIAAERIGAARSTEHYLDVLAKRLDKDKGMIYALKDSLLVPEDLPDSGIVMPADEDLIRKKMRQRAQRQIAEARAVAESHGLDPDEHAPKPLPPEEPVPDLEHLPDFFAKLEAAAEKQKEEAQQAKAESEKRLETLVTAQGMDFEVFRKEYTEKPKGPPDFSAREKIDLLEGMAEEMRQQGQDPEEIEAYLQDEDFRRLLFDGERQVKEGYRMAAHHQDPAPLKRGEEGARLRKMVIDACSRGESLAGKDLTGIDLSGLDLRGGNFEKAFMENANLQGAILDNVNLHRAVLAHANLTHARLCGADLSEANLGKTRCTDCNAEGADCRTSILAQADLSGACFKNADLTSCDCSGAVYNRTDFTGIQANQLVFLECDLRGLNLSAARLKQCAFIKVDLSGVDFRGAFLASAVFLDTAGKSCRFDGADMTNARFVGQCVFDNSNFSEAKLDDANLRGISLQDCDFTHTHINRTDFSECNLRGANFYRAVGREVAFVKADLNNAFMVSLNMMDGSLQRSDIRGADLRGSNLYQVDLARVHANPHTQLGDTFAKKVRIYPKRVASHGS